MNKEYSTKDIVITGLGIAIVFVSTLFIHVPNGLAGYYNLGDGFILLFASFLNPFLSFVIGGLGSALADVAGGYAYYFIFTLIIKGLEGFVISYMIHKGSKKLRFLSYVIGIILMVIGYFFAKWYLKGSVLIAISSIPGNIMQGILSIVVAMAAYPIFKRILSVRN